MDVVQLQKDVLIDICSDLGSDPKLSYKICPSH
jgi:hypothetical protein